MQAVPLVVAGVDVVRIARTWWRTHRFDVDPAKHIRVAQIAGKTHVTIDHTIPVSSPDGARWRITTTPQYLPKEWFHQGARLKIEKASTDRGRAIYCIDVTRGGGEVVAALSYHVDSNTRYPLIVTAIAFRKDRPELWQESRVAAWIAKRYVHALARKLRRHAHLDFASDSHRPAEDVPSIGFREVPPPPDRRQRHKHCYRQEDE